MDFPAVFVHKRPDEYAIRKKFLKFFELRVKLLQCRKWEIAVQIAKPHAPNVEKRIAKNASNMRNAIDERS